MATLYTAAWVYDNLNNLRKQLIKVLYDATGLL